VVVQKQVWAIVAALLPTAIPLSQSLASEVSKPEVATIAAYARTLPNILSVYRNGADGSIASINDNEKILTVDIRAHGDNPLLEAVLEIKSILRWAADHNQVAPHTVFDIAGDAENSYVSLSFSGNVVTSTDWTRVSDGGILNLSDDVLFDTSFGEAVASKFCEKNASNARKFCHEAQATKARLRALEAPQ
jgi:hypothetical protein